MRVAAMSENAGWQAVLASLFCGVFVGVAPAVIPAFIPAQTESAPARRAGFPPEFFSGIDKHLEFSRRQFNVTRDFKLRHCQGKTRG
jgi:hypothetical protein